MNNDKLEAEIKGQGLVELRVTPEHIESIITSEEYIVQGTYTICVLTLRNGFKVSGSMGCVSANNFDEDLGRKYARQKAVDQVWPLEGYLLAERMNTTHE